MRVAFCRGVPCECVFVLIHFQEYFQIDAFSMKTLSAVVWTEGMTHRNVCVFKRKPISGRGLRITPNDIIIQYNTLFKR